jgi:transposase
MTANDRDSLRQMLVPIDVSKYFHKAKIVGPRGEILHEPFEIDIYQDGLDRLLAKMKEAKAKCKAERVIFAMEPTSYYHQTLMDQLGKLGHEIQLINPCITSRVRSLTYDHVKTDDVDLEVLGSSVRLGKGNKHKERPKQIQKLRIITRQRIARTKHIKYLKIQIHQHLDALWPGFVNKHDKEKALVGNIWESQTAWALLQICPNPRKISKMRPKDLISLFHRHHVKGVIGPKRAEAIIKHAQGVLHNSIPLSEYRFNLRQDLQLLHHLNTVVSSLEARAIRLLPAEAKHLLSVKGVSPFYAAAFIAEIGDINNFKSPKSLIKYAGLNVSVKRSGLYSSKNNFITKFGNYHFRYATVMIARNLARCHPDFKAHYEKFRSRGMGHNEAIGCVATKVMKIFFYLLTRKEDYSSDRFQGIK